MNSSKVAKQKWSDRPQLSSSTDAGDMDEFGVLQMKENERLEMLKKNRSPCTWHLVLTTAVLAAILLLLFCVYSMVFSLSQPKGLPNINVRTPPESQFLLQDTVLEVFSVESPATTSQSTAVPRRELSVDADETTASAKEQKDDRVSHTFDSQPKPLISDWSFSDAAPSSGDQDNQQFAVSSQDGRPEHMAGKANDLKSGGKITNDLIEPTTTPQSDNSPPRRSIISDIMKSLFSHLGLSGSDDTPSNRLAPDQTAQRNTSEHSYAQLLDKKEIKFVMSDEQKYPNDMGQENLVSHGDITRSKPFFVSEMADSSNKEIDVNSNSKNTEIVPPNFLQHSEMAESNQPVLNKQTKIDLFEHHPRENKLIDISKSRTVPFGDGDMDVPGQSLFFPTHTVSNNDPKMASDPFPLFTRFLPLRGERFPIYRPLIVVHTRPNHPDSPLSRSDGALWNRVESHAKAVNRPSSSARSREYQSGRHDYRLDGDGGGGGDFLHDDDFLPPPLLNRLLLPSSSSSSSSSVLDYPLPFRFSRPYFEPAAAGLGRALHPTDTHTSSSWLPRRVGLGGSTADYSNHQQSLHYYSDAANNNNNDHQQQRQQQ